MKCRIINRLEETRNRSKFLRDRDKPNPEPQPQEQQPTTQDPLYTGVECPRCHKLTLRLIEGCKRCPACGYDACQWGDLEVGEEV